MSLRTSEKTWPFAAFFSLSYRRLYLSTAETRWCFSIEHPHLFHWASPSFPLSIPIFSTGRPCILRFPLRNPGNFLPNDAAVKGIWGYTLVYQAELNEGVDPDSALKELLPTIRRLHSSDDLHPLDSLTGVKVSGGRLWLLGIPVEGEGLEAATLYATLSPPNEAQALLDMFYGPAAMLLEPDLIAHKGYYLMRQYRGDELEAEYDESADGLRKTTSELLGGLSQDPPQTDKLTELAHKYQRLFSVVAKLSDLHTALVKQKHNYESSSAGGLEAARIGG